MLGSSGIGKSALAWTLTQRGHALMADNVTALAPAGGSRFDVPAYPRLRLWPDVLPDQFGAIGWVVFLVEVAQPGGSSFRYVDPLSGELVVVPDCNDIAYFFRVSAEAPLFWHGVLCESTYRWSQGFSLPDDWRSRVGC